jgi:hypothetical protein
MKLWKIHILFLITLITPFAAGCEPYQAITFDNRTSTTVKVYLDRVPLDYTGIPSRTWKDPGDIIGAGESKKFVTWVPDTRRSGLNYKYTIVAVTEQNEIVLSKVFTWDELHDMDWTVVIGGSNSDNAIMKNILSNLAIQAASM